MAYQEHEISAVHEAGHTVYIEQFYPELTGLFSPPPEMLPPRTTQIEIWYDEEQEIHDGQTVYSGNSLPDEQLLFIALSGRVAEIMARTEGNWDVPAMQKSILSGEFDHTRDMEKAKARLAKLIPDNQNNKREQLLAEAISQIFSSTSAILVQRGIPAVLAMQYEITDTAAIELSRTFYEALAEGLPVDAAVAEARKAINIGIRNTLEWGTPVLYMRSPDGVLFDLQLKRHKNSTNSATIEPTRIAPPIEEQVSLWLVAKTAISNSQRTREAYETHISEFRKVLQEYGLDLDCEDENTIMPLAEEWAAYSKVGKEVSAHTYKRKRIGAKDIEKNLLQIN